MKGSLALHVCRCARWWVVHICVCEHAFHLSMHVWCHMCLYMETFIYTIVCANIMFLIFAVIYFRDLSCFDSES